MGKIEITDKHESAVAARMMEGATLAWGEEPRNYLGMSQIGHPCKRKLWMDMRGYGHKPEPRLQCIFQLGHRVEDMVVTMLQKTGYRLEHTGKEQQTFSDCNGYLKGHGDGMIYGITTKPHLLEVKSANKKKFEEFQNKGYLHNVVYAAQVEAYMEHAKVDRALAVVMCKDNCDLYIERIRKAGTYASLRDKAWEVIRSEDFPACERIQECHFCDYKVACWTPDAFTVDQKVCGNCMMCVPKDDGFYCTLHEEQIPKWGLGCDGHKTRYPKSAEQTTCGDCKKRVGGYCLEFGEKAPTNGCRMKEV